MTYRRRRGCKREYLTPLARAIWCAAWSAQTQGRPCPSRRELCDRYGVSSTSVVAYHVQKLIRLGIATVEKDKSRALRIVAPYSWVEG